MQKRFILHISYFWTSYYWPIWCVWMELLSTLENHLFLWHLVAIEDDYQKKLWTKSRAQMKLSTDSPLLLVQYCQPKNSRLLMQRGTGTKRQAGRCLLFVESPAQLHGEKYTTDHGFSSGNQRNFFKSYQKPSNRSWLYFILETSTKKQFQNLNQL